ncbi:hypothetical protein ACRRTK_024306 [Alexandromys fortis]
MRRYEALKRSRRPTSSQLHLALLLLGLTPNSSGSLPLRCRPLQPQLAGTLPTESSLHLPEQMRGRCELPVNVGRSTQMPCMVLAVVSFTQVCFCYNVLFIFLLNIYKDLDMPLPIREESGFKEGSRFLKRLRISFCCSTMQIVCPCDIRVTTHLSHSRFTSRLDCEQTSQHTDSLARREWQILTLPILIPSVVFGGLREEVTLVTPGLQVMSTFAFVVIIEKTWGVDDLMTVAAGTMTGMSYRPTGGLRAVACSGLEELTLTSLLAML